MSKHTWIVLSGLRLGKCLVLAKETVASFGRWMMKHPPSREQAKKQDNGWFVFGSDGKETPVKMKSIEEIMKSRGDKK